VRTKISRASARLVAWFDALQGSEYQTWAWTVATALGLFFGLEHDAHPRAFQSWR
jgi:hypothetical protein